MNLNHIHLGVRDLGGALDWLDRIWHLKPRFQNENSLAGFSTYDLDKHGPELFADLAARGNPRWASSEGTNYNLSSPSPSSLTWDRYLGDMLAHNVALINVFGWNDPTPFGEATRSDEAKAAYRKFVSGQPLK